jgi:small-conductance mechanosensitive channel
MIPSILYLILGSAVIVAFFALVGEGLSRVLRQVGRRAGLKESTLIVIRDTSRAIWVVLAIVGVAYYTRLTSELTVIAVTTVGGLIVSLALQATLTNVIAGLFLLQDGTLRIGDDITYSGIAGRVVRITLRTSWIMTDKGVIVTVANSQLMNGPLVNRTATNRLLARYHLEVDRPPPPFA